MQYSSFKELEVKIMASYLEDIFCDNFLNTCTMSLLRMIFCVIVS